MKTFFEKINRLILLTRCILTFIFRGKANIAPPSPSSIIVVLTGKLGDMVCCTPLLRAIRKNLPNARVIVAGTPGLVHTLLADSGLADDYINLEVKGVIARIKKCHAEVALVTGPSFTSAALLYLSGIPLVVVPRVVGGFSPSETRPYKILQHFIKTFQFKMGEYAPRERLKCLEPIGIVSEDTKKTPWFFKAILKGNKPIFY